MSARTIVLWCPDWPITAAFPASTAVAVALVADGVVAACSAAARAAGVRRGMRMRDAHARCPGLLVHAHDPGLEARAFEPVLRRLEALSPGVQPLRPGLVALGARGPERYYGGERAAALALCGALDELGIPGSLAGIADGPFAAEQAARQASPRPGPTAADRVLIVPAGRTAGFLAPLPVAVLGDDELGTLLPRLGVHSLGAFAALPRPQLRDRFGERAARLHTLAAGEEDDALRPRVPAPELTAALELEPPLERVDQIAFAVRPTAERFVDALLAAHLVCTTLRIEAETAEGGLWARGWLHPRSFSPADVVDRVRWQLQALGESASLRSGIARLRLVPEVAEPVASHERGLFGSGPPERVHRAMARVQGMLGHGAVLQAAVGGGRMPGERAVLVPWGDPVDARRAAQPWPARLPGPAPAAVLPVRRPVHVLDDRGAAVDVDERGALSAAPARISTGDAGRALTAWAGPWPLEERWWDAEAARSAHRLQAVDETGSAWLLVLEGGAWYLEARYD
ncbi:MAG: DNA polymerase Y family protein [Microbacteriaceae bacterium]